MSNLVVQQRTRALEIITEQSANDNYLPIDYVIDSEARKVLSLPLRPKGRLPYVGWMVEKGDSPERPTRISTSGEALIKRWEGLRLKAYQDSAKVWTIGYGHTKSVKAGDKITRTEADKMFREDIKVYEQAVTRHVAVPLNQNQFDALVSFCYNVGETQFRTSTLLRLLNNGVYGQAADELFKWTRAGGRRIQGLANRRKDEYRLFNS